VLPDGACSNDDFLAGIAVCLVGRFRLGVPLCVVIVSPVLASVDFDRPPTLSAPGNLKSSARISLMSM
jgi:hypothetical protein